MFFTGLTIICVLVVITTLIVIQNYQGPDERLKKAKVFIKK